MREISGKFEEPEVNLDDTMFLTTGPEGAYAARIDGGNVLMSYDNGRTVFDIECGTNGRTEALREVTVVDGYAEIRMTDLSTSVQLEVCQKGGEVDIVGHDRTVLIRNASGPQDIELNGFEKIGVQRGEDGQLYELIVPHHLPGQLSADWFVNRVRVNHQEGLLKVELSPAEDLFQ